VESEQACGQGLADNAVLPAHLGAASAAIADVLEVHMNALDPDDGNSRLKQHAYAELVDEHREAAARLLAVADHMARFRDLPMGRHDPDAMASPEPYDAFVGLVAMKRHLRDLLYEEDARDQSMLRQMSAVSGEPRPGR